MLDKYESVYVDVDGTLLLWPGRSPGAVPRPAEAGHGEPPAVNEPLVDVVKKWHRDGRTPVVWSQGGAKHARMAADLCGLAPGACLRKPAAVVDDHLTWFVPGAKRYPVMFSPSLEKVTK